MDNAGHNSYSLGYIWGIPGSFVYVPGTDRRTSGQEDGWIEKRKCKRP